MEWNLEWGPYLKGLLQQHKRTGVKPAALARRPTFHKVDQEYFDAFHCLGEARTSGMGGMNPIPVSEILNFAEKAAGIDSYSERLKYINLIQKLDRAYLAFWHEKNKTSKS